MARAGLEAVARAIRAAQRIAVCCHVAPDGDTIGSALALYNALPEKDVTLFCPDKVPDNLADLPGSGAFRRCDSLRPEERFDLMLPLDISAPDRMGTVAGEPFEGLLRGRCAAHALVDHHATNPGFCSPACIDAGAPAAGIILRELLALLDRPLTKEIAACLYTAIATDTGNFSYGPVTPECFRIAAELLETGFDLAGLHRTLFVVLPEAKARLQARAMDRLRLSRGGTVAVTALSLRDFADCGALEEHAENTANMALAIQGVRMAAALRETPEGKVKASLRAVAPWTVNGLAQRLGGGGHPQAAGCTLALPLAEAAERLAADLGEELDRQA